MKTLISLEHFVQRQKEKFLRNEISKEECLFSIFDFTNNIQQQPQINHFIPCVEKDGKWELIEPYIKTESEVFADENATCRVISKAESKYYSASKNVLFDGWEVFLLEKEKMMLINNNLLLEFNPYTGQLISLDSYSDLTKYNLPLNDNGEIYFNLKN